MFAQHLLTQFMLTLPISLVLNLRPLPVRRYNCWSMAGKARTANFGLSGVFEREFWTNTPGELALVWDFKGEGAPAMARKKK